MDDIIKNFERDIIKKYRSKLWAKFVKAVKDFKLIEDGDKVLCAISGKDSIIMAKLLEEYQKHSDCKFDIEYIAMDPGYKPETSKSILDTCTKLGIPVNILKSDVFAVAELITEKNPCFMCARMRRGFLYSKAREYGCNKLALGHHYDDVIETTMLNLLYAGSFKSMVPKLRSRNFSEIELIRPLYFIREVDVIRIMKKYDIVLSVGGCELQENKQTSNKRQYIKELIVKLKEENEFVDMNIFRSLENVNATQILGYEDKLGKHDFDEIYERGEHDDV